MSEVRNLPHNLASGVLELVRERFGKTDSVLTAEGVAGVQSVAEIDRDYGEAAQCIRSAESEMLGSGVPAHLAIEKYRQALLLVQRHEVSILSQQVVLLLVNLTINVYNKIMGDAEEAINLLASMLPDETKYPAFKEKIMAEFVAAGGLTMHTAAQAEPPRPVAPTAPAAPRAVLAATEFLTASKTEVATQEVAELERVLALARVRLLYRKQLDAVELPAAGFTNPKQADLANQLTRTYGRLVELEKELNLPPTEKDARVTRGATLRRAFQTAQKNAGAASSGPHSRPAVETIPPPHP